MENQPLLVHDHNSDNDPSGSVEEQTRVVRGGDDTAPPAFSLLRELGRYIWRFVRTVLLDSSPLRTPQYRNDE